MVQTLNLVITFNISASKYLKRNWFDMNYTQTCLSALNQVSSYKVSFCSMKTRPISLSFEAQNSKPVKFFHSQKKISIIQGILVVSF